MRSSSTRAAVHPFDRTPLFVGELPPASVMFNLPVPPSANVWWRSRVVVPKDGGEPFSMTYLSPDARAYKANVAAEYERRPMSGPVKVTLDWYRERKSGDLDKRLGVLFDALQGVAYENDSQIVEIVARRHEDPANPRVVVTVEAL